MALLVSAKGSDLLAWRATGDFSATYRQVVLGRMEFCRSEEAMAMLAGVSHALEDLATANDRFCSHRLDLIQEVAACDELPRLGELTTIFFAGLYDHFDLHRSATSFYEFSLQFLKALAGSVSRCSYANLGHSSPRMPGLALIALGPAGRQEFTPFCPLQLMLVHGLAGDEEKALIQRYATQLHENFEACGLLVDKVVTPRNSQWRGSLSEWGQRLAGVAGRADASEIIEMLRLTDQTTLVEAADAASGFRQNSLSVLAASPLAVKNLVSRVTSLSNGIRIMGGLRFEKKGPYRGRFALSENALQPLSASLSALALLKNIESMATPSRVRELLWRRELNVDMAERLLLAWHALHELCLIREREMQPDWTNRAPFFLDVERMDVAEQEALREALETIGNIQRHVGINFSGVGE